MDANSIVVFAMLGIMGLAVAVELILQYWPSSNGQSERCGNTRQEVEAIVDSRNASNDAFIQAGVCPWGPYLKAVNVGTIAFERDWMAVMDDERSYAAVKGLKARWDAEAVAVAKGKIENKVAYAVCSPRDAA